MSLSAHDHGIAKHLASAFRTASPVLFLGAGFSLSCTDRGGTALPTGRELAAELYALVNPHKGYEGQPLGEVFGAAQASREAQLSRLMRERFNIDPESVSESVLWWLSLPWRRIYSLNVDNLAEMAQLRHKLPREISSISALRSAVPAPRSAQLDLVHLNGDRDDLPNVVFSAPQYGAALTDPTSAYAHLASDLANYPVVFVGTSLNEAPFWQHIEYKQRHRGDGPDLRARSYIVAPTLSDTQTLVLGQLNMVHWAGTADGFRDAFSTELASASAAGHIHLVDEGSRGVEPLVPIANIKSFAPDPNAKYLTGVKPTWGDLQAGRIVERAAELDVVGNVVVHGTAGSGVSSLLLRVAAAKDAAGMQVYWSDGIRAGNGFELVRKLRELPAGTMTVIDSIDSMPVAARARLLDEVFGEPTRGEPGLATTVVIGSRSHGLRSTLGDSSPLNVRRVSLDCPLSDREISDLLIALESENLLGKLGGLPRNKRSSEFKKYAKRQILVAMHRATSGEELEATAAHEYRQLDPRSRLIYGIICLASRFDFAVSKVQLALSSLASPDDLALTEALHEAGVVVVTTSGAYEARHPLVAQFVVEAMRTDVEVEEPYSLLLRAVALSSEGGGRQSRDFRLKKVLLSHDSVRRLMDAHSGRVVYRRAESASSTDHHYWLQRGCFELEHGNLVDARSYLENAVANGGENDFLVQVEYQYLRLLKACEDPSRSESALEYADASSKLLHMIAQPRAKDSPHVWCVYGDCALRWLDKGGYAGNEASIEASELFEVMTTAKNLFPENGKIDQLREQAANAALRLKDA